MSYLATTRGAGPAWTDGGIGAQPAINDHAAFMSALADEGFVLFAGPLAGTEHGHLRALLIVSAPTEVQIQRRFADDPWESQTGSRSRASNPGTCSSAPN